MSGDLPTFDSAAVARITGGRAFGAGPAGSVTANYLTMAPGEWFVALAGPGFDDHVNVATAHAKGLAGALVERRMPVDLPQVVVPDTWRALRDLARAARRAQEGPVVAITGSVGKTTTRALTQLALAPLGAVHHTNANENHEPGVPLTLLTTHSRTAPIVLELGAAKPGDIATLTAVAEPDIRVVTRVAPAHLATLLDLDGVLREKSALLDGAKAGDVAVLPTDDARLATLPLDPVLRRVRVGPGGDVELTSVRVEDDGLDATWRTPDGVVHARIPSPAPFLAHNACAALAVAWVAGADLRASAASLEHYVPVGTRLARVEVRGAVVYDDTFNASPVSVRAALDVLAARPGRRIAMLGDMLELGASSDRYHTEIAEHAAGLGLDEVVLVGAAMARVVDRVPGATHASTATEAAAYIEPRPGDVILLKGSRGMRMDAVLKAWQTP